MNYQLTQHAQQRMAERGISQSVLEAILQSPDQIVPEKDGKVAYQSQVTLGGRTFLIRLIVNDQIVPLMVVTVIKTTDVARYWQ